MAKPTKQQQEESRPKRAIDTKSKRPRGRPRTHPMPDPIPDTPDNVARILMTTKPSGMMNGNTSKTPPTQMKQNSSLRHSLRQGTLGSFLVAVIAF